MELSLFQVLILAAVQGVTEFLPISSDGHLVIAANLLSGGDPSAMDIGDVGIVLHMGTLGSILVFYWRRVLSLLGEDRRVALLLMAGTIPAVIVGLPAKLFFSDLLENTLAAGCMLIVTGLMLLFAANFHRGERPYQQLTLRQSLLIGLAQATAILPGLSRSGTTISAGLSMNLSPKSAATFSFLLAIPAIAGAGVLELLHMLGGAKLNTPLDLLLLGACASFVIGLATLWLLMRWVEKGRLQWFAYWCIPLGVLVILMHFYPPFAHPPQTTANSLSPPSVQAER